MADTDAMPLTGDDPTRIGPYTLLARLGAGGMGVVYLGRRTDDDRRGTQALVAVKMIRREWVPDEPRRAAFVREAQAAQRVPPSTTAAVLDVGVEDGLPYLVTEYVGGPTLAALVASEGPLAPPELDELALAMAVALDAIHTAGVVHRDLKPSNVLMAPAGPRVVDFGQATFSDLSDSATTWVTPGFGTPAFMAPEQARGEAAGPPADVFAWGGVILFASTGRTPFGSEPIAEMLYRLVYGEIDLTGLPAHLRPVVRAAMRTGTGCATSSCCRPSRSFRGSCCT